MSLIKKTREIKISKISDEKGVIAIGTGDRAGVRGTVKQIALQDDSRCNSPARNHDPPATDHLQHTKYSWKNNVMAIFLVLSSIWCYLLTIWLMLLNTGMVATVILFWEYKQIRIHHWSYFPILNRELGIYSSFLIPYLLSMCFSNMTPLIKNICDTARF